MYNDQLFQEIRPYRDEEVSAILRAMANHPISDQIIKANFPGHPVDRIKANILKIGDVDTFQKEVIYYVIKNMLNRSSDGLSWSGMEHLINDKAYTFVSNHRDITLDPSLLNFALVENGFSTTEVAIGDNLLENEWVKELVRINKGFIVQRNLPPRELVKAAQILSKYIYYTVLERSQSIWIAQREGRAKDGDDRTHPGILNMMAMSAEGDLIEHFNRCNIVPMVISYEYDPCDADKIWSVYSKKYLGGYVKSSKEDQLAMQKGIEGKKGHIHIHICRPIATEIQELSFMKQKKELIHEICKVIDREVWLNYRNWPTNYIAFDLLKGDDRLSNHYTEDQKQLFIETLEHKVSQLDGDKDILRSMLYRKYANPVINKLAIQEQLAQQQKS